MFSSLVFLSVCLYTPLYFCETIVLAYEAAMLNLVANASKSVNQQS